MGTHLALPLRRGSFSTHRPRLITFNLTRFLALLQYIYTGKVWAEQWLLDSLQIKSMPVKSLRLYLKIPLRIWSVSSRTFFSMTSSTKSILIAFFVVVNVTVRSLNKQRKLIPVVMPMIGPLAFLCHQAWYSDKRMSRISNDSAPAFLFLSGTKDDLIPTSHFRILYDLCPSKQKRWKAFKDGTHSLSYLFLYLVV
jgi:hypothetical protein